MPHKKSHHLPNKRKSSIGKNKNNGNQTKQKEGKNEELDLKKTEEVEDDLEEEVKEKEVSLSEELVERQQSQREAFHQLLRDNVRLEKQITINKEENEKNKNKYEEEREKTRELRQDLRDLKEKHTDYVLEQNRKDRLRSTAKQRKENIENEEELEETEEQEDDPVKVRELQLRLIRICDDLESQRQTINVLNRLLKQQDSFLSELKPSVDETLWNDLQIKHVDEKDQQLYNPTSHSTDIPQSSVCILM